MTLLRAGFALAASMVVFATVPAKAQDGNGMRHMRHRMMRHEMRREMMRRDMMRGDMHREMRHERHRRMMRRMMNDN